MRKTYLVTVDVDPLITTEAQKNHVINAITAAVREHCTAMVYNPVVTEAPESVQPLSRSDRKRKEETE